MKTMTLNKRAKLLVIGQGFGHGGGETVRAETAVFCKVADLSTTEKMNDLAAGVTADLQVHLWRKEFEKADYTHIKIGEVMYKIVKTGSGFNDLFVKLTVTRC